MKYQHRMTTVEDKDNLLDFWNKYSGWDDIDSSTWEHRFENGPCGPAPISILQNPVTDEILAQMVFIPSMVSISGNVYKACRPFAFAFHPEIRNTGKNAFRITFLKLLLNAVKALKSNGYDLLHSNPDPRWMWLLSKMPFFLTGTFPLFSLKLPISQPFLLSENTYFKKINPHDKRIDELWEKAKSNYSSIIVRNSKILPWKLSHGDYQLHGVFHNSRLIGIFASIQKSEDKQYLICDILSEDTKNSLEKTLTCATIVANKIIRSQSTEYQLMVKVALLATPLMLPILNKLGYHIDNYSFPLVIQRLNKSIPKKDIQPKNWYISAND